MSRRRVWMLYVGVFGVTMILGWIWLDHITSPAPLLDRAPLESHRVIHPSGFSIIPPERMRGTINLVSDDQINILPDGGRSRYTPVMGVIRWADAPYPADLARSGFRPGQFQDQDAMVYRGPSGKYDAWRATFLRGSHWYEVCLLLPGGDRDPQTMPPDAWWPFLNTFRVETPTTKASP